MAEQCAGTILGVIYQNEENGYTVLRLVTDDGEVVTATGCLPFAAPGEDLLLTGEWTVHPSYGEQFKAAQAERSLPTNEQAVFDYLSSGVIKGVGPTTAEKIIARFGGDALRILEKDPDKLSDVRGISARKAKEIAASFRYQTGMRRTLEFLARHSLPLALAMRLYRRYGAEAMEAVQENPYLLADEYYGVDFTVMDRIALEMGFTGSEALRIEAAVLFELSSNASNGHVFLPREKLLQATAKLLACPMEPVEIALDNLIGRKGVVQESIGRETACYLYRLWEAETCVDRRLRMLLHYRPDKVQNADAILDRIQAQQGISYAPAQRAAVALAAERGVMLLTGGPGTGKTTSVRGIVAMFDALGMNVLLLAPTGRAAKRMSELCGREAQTIHRCLGMCFDEQSGQVTFTKGEQEPLEAEAVIVDEMSMVDLPLMRALLTALPPACRLVLVGDPDQLPSVGPGNVFGDMIRSRLIATAALTEIFRQAQESAIVRNAHAVNHTGAICLDTNQKDFFVMVRRSPQRLVDTIVSLCQTRLPENMGIPQDQIQVLCPTRRGPWGTAALNAALQAALNPPAPEKGERTYGDITFRTGDRVMQIRNNYDVIWERPDGTVGTGVFNGDVGRITALEGDTLTIAFDDRVTTYTIDQLQELELAYAVTVHKAQGSEYRAVILAAMPCNANLMVRGVLYTAITRARELMILVGDDSAIREMAQNDRHQRRYSGLRCRLVR